MLQLMHEWLAKHCEPPQRTIRWLFESVHDDWWVFVTTLDKNQIGVSMAQSIPGVRFEDLELKHVATIQDDLVESSFDIKPFLDNLRVCECASGH